MLTTQTLRSQAEPQEPVQTIRAKRYGHQFRSASVSALYDELVNTACDIDNVTDLSHPAVLTCVSREAHRFITALEDADFLGYESGYQLLHDIRRGLLGNIDSRDHQVVAAFYAYGRSTVRASS